MGLEARLGELARAGETITYGALARALGLTAPGSIGRLTTALEALMEADAKAGRPLRAALCSGRLGANLPAAGFFEKARALGLYEGVDPIDFVADQREKLSRRHTE